MRWWTWGSFDEAVARQLRVYRRRGVPRSERWCAEHPDAWATLASVAGALPIIAFAGPGAGAPIGAVIVAGLWYPAGRRYARVVRAAIELVEHGEVELLDLEHSLAEARSSRDLAAAEGLLHADFEETRGIAGSIRVPRSAWLDELVNGPGVRVTLGPRQVELRPGRAVVSGGADVVTATGTDHERNVAEWVRDCDRWQLWQNHVEVLRRSRV